MIEWMIENIGSRMMNATAKIWIVSFLALMVCIFVLPPSITLPVVFIGSVLLCAALLCGAAYMDRQVDDSVG